MKYAFLTTLIPKQIERTIRKRSKHVMNDAANALQWHIYDGLCANFEDEIKLFNILPIGSFPQYYSKPFVKKQFFDDETNKGHINIGFCNIKLIRKWHQPKKIFSQLKKWCNHDNDEKTLFVYTVSAPFMIAVRRLKKRFPKLKVCAIVADLPDMSNLSSKKSIVKKLFEKKLASDSYSSIESVDAFVLLTKQMADYMKITKPYLVMEGIATTNQHLASAPVGNIKTILYTGTLHKRFGVLNLVDAFMSIKRDNYRLTLCGVGDCETEIIRLSNIDKRIEFKGQLTREEVLELQSKATVLVNPRQNNEEFTKYSFPSKNLEYLSSGVPLVAYKLDGIPDEYDEYINYVPDNNPLTLARVIQDVCELSEEEWAIMGQKAQKFVLENKNYKVQAKRILDFIKEGI